MKDTQEDVRQIVIPLLRWYHQNARQLPWREYPTPYRVWVSEIMLQQTRVEAVRPYFDRFLEALPSISSLAQADEETLLKLWQGLGYYNRVRNMQRAAKILCQEYGGELPRDVKQLEALPGIGAYTAGAIASIAMGLPAPLVDGNVWRVFSRLLRLEADGQKPRERQALAALLEKILPKECPGDFNQALMEIGALICLPGGRPKCEDCPLAEFCQARAAGVQQAYPKKSPKKPRPVEEKTLLLLLWEGKVAVRKRGEKELLAGMWEFPWLTGSLAKEDVVKWLEKEKIKGRVRGAAGEATHVFTHRIWQMQGYFVGLEQPWPGEGICWVTKQELQARAVPSAFQMYFEAVMPYLL